jgi:NAD-dependent DNA ligase
MNEVMLGLLDLVGLYSNYSGEIDPRVEDEDLGTLMTSVEELDWSANKFGVDGDDGRYDRSNYQPEVLKELLEDIADVNDCSTEDVTDEMFSEYVRPDDPGIPTETAKFRYSKADGKSSFFYTDTMVVEKRETDEGSGKIISQVKPHRGSQSPEAKSVEPGFSDDYPSEEESERDWMKQFSKYVSRNEDLSFQGKICVVTGAERRPDWPDIEEKLLAAGAVFRGAVSGKTNYLICDPKRTLAYKSEQAVKQIKAGKAVKIILIDDVIAALF